MNCFRCGFGRHREKEASRVRAPFRGHWPLNYTRTTTLIHCGYEYIYSLSYKKALSRSVHTPIYCERSRSRGTYFDALANLKRALKVYLARCLAFYSLHTHTHKESGGLVFSPAALKREPRCCCCWKVAAQKQWLVVFVLLFDELDSENKFLLRGYFHEWRNSCWKGGVPAVSKRKRVAAFSANCISMPVIRLIAKGAKTRKSQPDWAKNETQKAGLDTKLLC